MRAAKKNTAQICVFTVPGRPQPKARARVVSRVNRKTGKVRTWAYTPKTTRNWEARCTMHARTARPEKWPLDRRYAVTVRLPIAGRFDVDNVLKSVFDACNTVLWHDDSQIVSGEFVRALLDDECDVVVSVYP